MQPDGKEDEGVEPSGAAGPSLVWGHGMGLSVQADNAIGLLDWDALAQACRLLRYDARGHGASSFAGADPGDPVQYQWPNLARDMLALADQAGCVAFVAGGQSMGAATALHAALMQPQRVRALVLVTPPTAWERRPAHITLFERLARLVEVKGTPAFVGLMRQRPAVAAWLLAQRPSLLAVYAQAAAGFEAAQLAAILRGTRCDLPPRELLRSLTMPALILAWDDDDAHPLVVAEELHGLLPGARLAVARSVGQIAGWTGLVRDFLDGLGRANLPCG